MRARARSAAGLLAWGLAAWPVAAGAAELRGVEAVGAVPGSGSEAAGSEQPRAAALREALRQAVWQVAEELAAGMQPPPDASRLPELLGEDPFPYTPRYRILEDRGEGPPELLSDPAVSSEYVIAVEAWVDVAAVRQALGAGRGSDGAGRGPAGWLWIVLEGSSSYAAYAATRALVAGTPGVESVLPVEFERGRAVLAVRARSSPTELLAAILARAGGSLDLVPLGIDGSHIGLRVWGPREPAPAPTGALEGPARD